MTPEIEYLDLEDLLSLAAGLLGSPPPIRDIGLLGSAVARPRTTVLGADAYQDIWTKAAALLQSLLKNHALVDGNKRLAWLATATFLEVNGVPAASAANDEVYEFVMAAAAGRDDVGDLARRLQELCSPGR